MDDLGRAILDLERRPFFGGSSKERAMWDELGLTAGRYHEMLDELLADPEAERVAPALIRALRAQQFVDGSSEAV